MKEVNGRQGTKWVKKIMLAFCSAFTQGKTKFQGRNKEH